MDLWTLCETWPKQYSLNSKLHCFPNIPWPRNCVSFKLQSFSIGALRRASASLSTVCLASHAASRRLPLRTYLSKSCAKYCSQDMVVPRLIFRGAKVAVRFPRAGLRSGPPFAAPPATSSTIRYVSSVWSLSERHLEF